MPGVLHQGIISLLCDDPWLAFDNHGRQRPVDGTPIDRRADLDHETDDPEKAKMRYVDVVLEAALARPTAAVLAAALHGCRGNLDAVHLGIAACQGLPEKKRRRYIATILAAVPKRLRGPLMKGMNVEQENELWDIERRGMSYSLGLEHGLNQARDEGRRATLVEVILAVLEVRGIQLDADTRARIRSCESLATLQDWARRAREVARLQELFEPS